ncbi:MAG: DUF4157 domain-containing protein [Candidatus Sphingomonas phytovorans]|nr:DUF4157 domain-containing protein [Sphingomonas sp.]WEK00447.1 MAG: DUF4157 domain-containing protein [Sphingomonas sp.]
MDQRSAQQRQASRPDARPVGARVAGPRQTQLAAFSEMLNAAPPVQRLAPLASPDRDGRVAYPAVAQLYDIQAFDSWDEHVAWLLANHVALPQGLKLRVGSLGTYLNRAPVGSKAVYLPPGQPGLTEAGVALRDSGARGAILLSSSYVEEVGTLPKDERVATLLSTIRHEVQHAENFDEGLVSAAPSEAESALDETIAHSENILNAQLGGTKSDAPLWDQVEHLAQAEKYFESAGRAQGALKDKAAAALERAQKEVRRALAEHGENPAEMIDQYLNLVDFDEDGHKLANKSDAMRTVLQGKFADTDPVAQRAAEPAGNRTGMPDNLKSGIEALSGISMNGVKVHYNSASPAQLNAHAYAQGSDIHLAPGQERHLPHEAWHVVQQAQGRVAPTRQMKAGTPINDDAGLEREADVMGARAAGMTASATNTALAEPNASGPAAQRVAQLYRLYPVSEQTDQQWNAGKPVRVSEDGNLAVGQDDGYGSHDLWAEAGMIEPTNERLQTSGSRYRVAAGDTTLSGTSPVGNHARTLTKVVPSYGPTGDSGEDMTMPDDCGTAAHELTGAMGDDDTKTEMVAVFRNTINLAAAVTTAAEDQPAKMKREILLPFIMAKSNEDVPSFFSFVGVGPSKRNLIDLTRLRQLDRPINAFRHAMERMTVIRTVDLPEILEERRQLQDMDPLDGGFAARQLAFKQAETRISVEVNQIRDLIQRIAPTIIPTLKQIDDLIVASYEKLTPAEKDTFEQRAQINRYAAPEPGQAFAISTGGAPKNIRRGDGTVQVTYNVHWAGVLMKSGGDTVTMENSAEHIVVPRNTNWIFQMYGAASNAVGKRGQTFHEQNRDVIGAHGQSPTTMTVKPRDA